MTLYRFILAEKARFEVRVMCDVFGIAPSRYYEWERKQQSEHATKDAELLALIRAIFAKFRGRYGAPRIHDQLARQEVCVSRKRVARLMREAGLKAKGRRKYKATTDSNHGAPVAPNVLERDFHVERPDAAWASDITYIWTRQGWMYLAVILDLYSRKVVGWSLAERMTADLVCDAIDAAVRLRRPKPGLIFHCDRGSQYASRAFRRRLWRHQMRQSMSRKGNCWDSRRELLRDPEKGIDPRPRHRHARARRAEVFEYIEVFYNRQRAHSLLNYETPDAFEICFEKENAA